MALAAGHNGMATSVRGTAVPDCPRWSRRRPMLAAAVALWAALVGVCSVFGPSPVLWASIAALWAVLALVCIRIQTARGLSPTLRGDAQAVEGIADPR